MDLIFFIIFGIANFSVLAALWVYFGVKRSETHKKSIRVPFLVGSSCFTRNLFTGLAHSSGQAAVEFTLTFLLFLVIAWIPADFGLGFYSGQLAQNASREAARIAAADPNLSSANCNMPCSSASAGSALKAAADRMSQALLPGALISVTLEPAAGTNCNRLAEVSISGNYKFFFYRLLQSVGVPSSSISDPANIQRSTKMRWEHQPGCQA